MQIRGGSSKGLYFSTADLPTDPRQRDQVLLDAVGRDARQIDGLGGADPLTSKVAVLNPSDRADADIDFLFVQIVVGENRVDTTPTCGNILAGTGAFAIESGWLQPTSPTTRVRVYMVNTDTLCELELSTPEGELTYAGDARIDGVPGSAAPVICHYLDTAGAVCGKLFPSGNRLDRINGVEVTCIDNGMPVVVLRATDFAINGYESPAELNANDTLKARLETIRLQAGPLMNLGDVTAKAVPKMCLISPSREGGLINTRTFIPHRCHAAVGVLGAVTAATACILPGTVATGMADVPPGNPKQVSVEHPSGEFTVNLALDASGETVVKAGVLRTARLLSKGELYLPSTGAES